MWATALTAMLVGPHGATPTYSAAGLRYRLNGHVVLVNELVVARDHRFARDEWTWTMTRDDDAQLLESVSARRSRLHQSLMWRRTISLAYVEAVALLQRVRTFRVGTGFIERWGRGLPNLWRPRQWGSSGLYSRLLGTF